MSAYTDSLTGHKGPMTSPGQIHHVQSVNIDAGGLCRTRYRLSPYHGIGGAPSSLSPCSPPICDSSTPPRPCPLPPLHPAGLDLHHFAFQGQVMAGIAPCSGPRPLSPSTILLTQAQPLVMMNGGHFDPASIAMPDGYPHIPLPPGYEHLYNGFELHNSGYRKNVTKETTGPLKAWLGEHRKNPYPTKAEKIMLAIITKMTLTQVSTWFANARRRLKKETSPSSSPDSEHRKGTHERRSSDSNRHSSPRSSPDLRAELPDSSKCSDVMMDDEDDDDEEISVDDYDDDDGNDDGDEDERQRAALRIKERRVPVIYQNPCSAKIPESRSGQCCDEESSPNTDPGHGDYRPRGSSRDSITSTDYHGDVNNGGVHKCAKISSGSGSSSDQIPKNSHSFNHSPNKTPDNRSAVHRPSVNENSTTKPKIWSISSILDFSGSCNRDIGNT